MDILAHFLWTLGIFFKQKKAWLFGIIGFLPDLISFGPHFVYNIAFNGFKFGKPDINTIPDYIMTMYNLTHSLIVFLIVFAIVYFFFKEYVLFLLPWVIHILIDIPTHSKAFFPTPFLWPISGFMVDGISWGAPWFMITNYSLLVTFLAYRVFTK